MLCMMDGWLKIIKQLEGMPERWPITWDNLLMNIKKDEAGIYKIPAKLKQDEIAAYIKIDDSA